MAMVSEATQPLLQSHEVEAETERQESGIRIKFEQFLHNLKVQKSIEILKSALTIFTSNANLTFLMILAILPFFAFIVIYEFHIPKLLDFIAELLVKPSETYYFSFGSSNYIYSDENVDRRERFRNLIQLVPFHLVFSPLIEFFGLSIIINLAAAMHSGENESSDLQENLHKFFHDKNKPKGPFITCVFVQLLSNSTLFGLFWILANHYIVTSGNYYYYFSRDSSYINIISVGIHSLLFGALLYKYLDWSAMWNMSIVISVLEEETGIDALEMSAFFGKHSRTTGFQLMLVFFVYSVGVRLPLFLGGVIVTAIVIVLLCFGTLVKWVALVLYYNECKSQIMLKKGDHEEVGKGVKTGLV